MRNRNLDLCRFPPGWPSNMAPQTESAFTAAARKPATVDTSVRKVYAYGEYTLATLVGAGDPFNRQPQLRFNVDSGTLLNVGGPALGPNDTETIRSTGGAPRENTTRWDHLTWHIAKSTTGNDTHIWEANLNGRLIGHARMFWNPGGPVTLTGRIGDAGPVMSDAGESLEYFYYGTTIPANASMSVRVYAVGYSTLYGEIPAMTGVVIPDFRVLENAEVG